MASLSIQSLWNANVYIEGVGFVGAASEIEIPQPVRRMADYGGLGMMARIRIPVGWDVLESRIRWVSFEPAAISAALAAFNVISLQAMGDVQIISASGQISEGPAIFNMTGLFTDVGRVPIRGQENTEIESMFNAYHVELLYLGASVYVFDSLSNIFTIGGVDQLSNFRNNVGA